jgi:hypothetical protein
MPVITTSSILSVVSSLVSAEEYFIFTSALEAGALYTGNSLGQILEYILTGRDTLSQINDFDLFKWVTKKELDSFSYTDYRGSVNYDIPENYKISMGLPEYSGKVSLVKVHSWAATSLKEYFTKYPMGNWVDCWMTKDEVYLGASFVEFTQEGKLNLNTENFYKREAVAKYEKKLSQGYLIGEYFLIELLAYKPFPYDSIFSHKVENWYKCYSNLPFGIVQMVGYSKGYLDDGRWKKILDLLQEYLNSEDDCSMIPEWSKLLKELNPLEFRKLNYVLIAKFCYQYYKICHQTVKELEELVYSSEYQYYSQKQALADTIQPVDKKWKVHNYTYQQMFKLLIAQGYTKLKYALAIKPDEWKSGKISKGTMMYLGVKGSPKISKVLLALGLNEKMVSIVLGAGKVATSSKNKATTIRGNKQSFLEQGNSVYYSSCQATDPRASWSSGQHLNEIDGDLPFIGDTLFLWTIGSLMSEDGKGFVCRAKLRVIFKPTDKVLGLYIDRVYGSESLLRDYTYELEEWWAYHSLSKHGVHTPVFESSYTGDYIEFKSPSSVSGYQDNLSHLNVRRIKEVSAPQKSLLYQAYCSRDKSEGCYTKPLKEVRYNPQNGKFS